MIIAIALLAAAPTLSVPQVIARHRELSGRTVSVAGWIPQCRGLGCFIGPSPKLESVSSAISLGATTPGLEKRLRGAVGREVVLTLRVNPQCWPEPDAAAEICLDRADQAKPLSITIISRTPAKKD